MRIASFNVENLFDRPRVLRPDSGFWRTEGRPVLAAFERVSSLLQRDPYTEADKAEILACLGQLRLLRSDASAYVRLRRLRGSLLRRQRNGRTIVVARGRSAWIGWVELITEHVDQLAMQHTAMVLRDVDADVLGVVEATSRPSLEMFSSAMLRKVGGTPYPMVMLVDGNDPRGIDVGLMTKAGYVIEGVRSHIWDRDATGVIFSRDCCEYHVRTPSGELVAVLVNHLKSKGYGSPSDPIGEHARHRQAARIAEIYGELVSSGIEHVAVVGDLNDSPSSASLAPLLNGTDLRDISSHRSFRPGEREGTYGSGGISAKFDYVLLSPSLFTRVSGGAIFRKGVHCGPRTRNRWETYPQLTSRLHEASDHAAVWADIDI